MIIDNEGTYTLKYTATDSCGKTTTVDRELVVEKKLNLFGVVWDGTSNSKLTRINDSASFEDPVPQHSDGNGGWVGGSSPFDSIMPWAGIRRETDQDYGDFVYIPEFWYLITQNEGTTTFQIANIEMEGFCYMPETRVGRYLCNNLYKSQSGFIPLAERIGNFQSGINSVKPDDVLHRVLVMHSLTAIQLLYLVEFADFNSQKCIGQGCSTSGSVEQTGGTDQMTYHTGTSATRLSDYGAAQYRHIEGLWDNLGSFVGNVRIRSNTYSVGISATDVPTPSARNGIISNIKVLEYLLRRSGETITFRAQAFFPIEVVNATDNMENYICDQYQNASGGELIAVGGRAYQSSYSGMFRLTHSTGSTVDSTIGCRISSSQYEAVQA